MAKEYELTAFDVGREPYVDPHGNTWCTAVFLGEGEPVKWVVKDPTAIKVGQKYYGSIVEQTSKAGKPYLRFKREKPPENTYVSTDNKQSDEYWSERNDAIKAQFAIKTAVELLKNPEADDISEELIEHWARSFFNMVERVAGGSESENPKENGSQTHNTSTITRNGSGQSDDKPEVIVDVDLASNYP